MRCGTSKYRRFVNKAFVAICSFDLMSVRPFVVMFEKECWKEVTASMMQLDGISRDKVDRCRLMLTLESCTCAIV